MVYERLSRQAGGVRREVGHAGGIERRVVVAGSEQHLHGLFLLGRNLRNVEWLGIVIVQAAIYLTLLK